MTPKHEALIDALTSNACGACMPSEQAKAALVAYCEGLENQLDAKTSILEPSQRLFLEMERAKVAGLEADNAHLKAIAKSRLNAWTADLIKCNTDLTALEKENAQLKARIELQAADILSASHAIEELVAENARLRQLLSDDHIHHNSHGEPCECPDKCEIKAALVDKSTKNGDPTTP